jgi:L-cysteine S-thiosulfotransferase
MGRQGCTVSKVCTHTRFPKTARRHSRQLSGGLWWAQGAAPVAFLARQTAVALSGFIFAGALSAAAADIAPTAIVVVGDTIPASLTGTPGDASRGRAIVLDRAVGNCLICHQVPVPAEPNQGSVGPDLTGIGARLTIPQIRLRLVDQSRLNPSTLMPPLYRTTGLTRVAPRYKDQPVLSAAQIEDVVAYLALLKD